MFREQAAEGPVNPSPDSPDTNSPRGYRVRGDGRVQGLIYANESKDGKQHACGTFSTVEEALEARVKWLELNA